MVTEDELGRIPHDTARVIWAHPTFDHRQAQAPVKLPSPWSAQRLAGHALSALYLGLCRHHRGEGLSGWRLVHGQALEAVLTLWDRKTGKSDVSRDPFAVERRFEARNPQAPDFSRVLSEPTPQAALWLLGQLEDLVTVTPSLAQAIRQLCGSKPQGGPGLHERERQGSSERTLL